MSDRQGWDTEVSSLMNKSTWYDSVAEAYDRTRPRYPAEILARMQQIAQLQPGKSVLEIGAGPGIASIELAKLGAETICLEPSPSACEIARHKCEAYSNVKVVNQTFETSNFVDERFDAVVATTSFHWVTPEARYIKTATVLKENGLLILLWNTAPQPNYEVHHGLEETYQQYAPELAKYQGHQNHQENLLKIAEEVIKSGYFKDLISEQLVVKGSIPLLQ